MRRSFPYLAAWVILPAAFAQAPFPLVNLARLPIASVYAGPSAGQDEFYGPRNLFDGGRHSVNGIDYSYWLPGEAPFYVIVRFAKAVTVTGIVVEIGGEDGVYAAPDGFTVHLRTEPGPGFAVSSKVAIAGSRTVYAPFRPVSHVREVMLLFTARTQNQIRVDEVEIFGAPPPGFSRTQIMPRLDSPPALSGAGNNSFTARLARAEIASMRDIRAAIDRAPSASAKAEAWLRLNLAADRLAPLLGHTRNVKLTDEAAALGISWSWCDPGADWGVGVQGYQQYLKLLPAGPRADEAWWRSRISGPHCGDFEGSPEEYKALITTYSDFLQRFPNSQFRPLAEQRLAEYRKALQ